MVPGATEISDFPTNLCAGADPFGLYEIDLSGVSGDPGSVLSTTFLVYDVLELEPHTWGAVKSLYRP